MCGRFSNLLTWQEIHDLYDIHEDQVAPNLAPRSNIAPTQSSLVIRRDDAGPQGKPRRMVSMLRWGLVPFWAKSPRELKISTSNARAETITTKAAYRDAIRKRHAIAPVCGWFEWTGEKGAKKPWRFVRVDGAPVSLAAIWERWTPRADAMTNPTAGGGSAGAPVAEDDLGPLESFSIITTDASADTAAIHDRMPVVLEKGDLDLWLDPDPAQLDRQLALLRPAPAGTIRYFPVSPEVNSWRNTGLDLVREVAR